MAIRRKTGREDWATRYGGGKRAPKETATTMSGLPVEPLYTPDDLAGWSYDEKLGYPGEFPYTRGVYPSMYRGQLWTIRQFAGYGSAQETNRRYQFLLKQGQAGLSEMLHKFWLGQSWLSSWPLNPARTLTGASWRVTALHPMNPTSLLNNRANFERRGSRATK